jgi:hypothetical protein
LGWPGDREVLIFASFRGFKLEKAGLAPAFLFVWIGHSPALKLGPQQTVDGVRGALEIERRSSYVPSSPIGD